MVRPCPSVSAPPPAQGPPTGALPLNARLSLSGAACVQDWRVGHPPGAPAVRSCGGGGSSSPGVGGWVRNPANLNLRGRSACACPIVLPMPVVGPRGLPQTLLQSYASGCGSAADLFRPCNASACCRRVVPLAQNSLEEPELTLRLVNVAPTRRYAFAPCSHAAPSSLQPASSDPLGGWAC